MCIFFMNNDTFSWVLVRPRLNLGSSLGSPSPKTARVIKCNVFTAVVQMAEINEQLLNLQCQERTCYKHCHT